MIRLDHNRRDRRRDRRDAQPMAGSVRASTVVLVTLLLSCLTFVSACVRAPATTMVTTTDKSRDKSGDQSARHPSAPVEERELTTDDIRAELWPRERTTRFQSSTLIERQTIAAIVQSLVRGAGTRDAPLPQLAYKAQTIGFRLQSWRVAGQRYWALVEAEDKKRGGGAYIVRVGQAPERPPQVLLQAPHAYYDLGTGILALRLFFADNRRVVALFTNTVHRYWDESGDYQKRERSHADVCHHTNHVFQHATDGAARALADLVVIQLHGFADTKHRPDAIVSSGDPSQSSPLVRRLSQQLKATLGDVRRFPEEVDELGGTTNAQGRLLSTSRRAHFVHLELSARVRKELRSTPEKLAHLAATLFGSALDDPEMNPGTDR